MADDASKQWLQSVGSERVQVLVDDICREADATEASSFPHFKSKDELAVAAIEHLTAVNGQIFASELIHAIVDPRDRVFANIDFRATTLLCSCLVMGLRSRPDLRESEGPEPWPLQTTTPARHDQLTVFPNGGLFTAPTHSMKEM